MTMSSSYRKLILIFGFAIAISLFFGCSKNENPVDNNQIVGSGKLVSESRVVGTFTGIQVTNFAKVFITQDTVESLRLESDDNIIDRVVTSVTSNMLIVGLRDGSYSKVTVNVYASMKTIKRFESTGTAEFSTINSIQTDSLTCKITGAGSFTLTGKTNYESIEIIGSGDVHNFNLISSFCSVTISGAGNVEAYVTQQLDATIAGTGNITYAGNPPVVHQIISGVGTIQPKH
jgi:hypothetical protein